MPEIDGKAEKQRGLATEKQLIEAFGWVESSSHDDINLDIDAYTAKGTPLSIKAIGARTFNRHGNLAFELETYSRRTQKWSFSWFHNGQATKYIFSIEGRGLYVINKPLLLAWVAEHGWPRVAELRADTRRSQEDMGHDHVNSRVGLVKLDTLLRAGVAKRLKDARNA